MIASRPLGFAFAIAALGASSVQAQQLEVTFVSAAPQAVPIAAGIVAVIALLLAFVAHRSLRGRTRIVGVMAAALTCAGALGLNLAAPGASRAGQPPVSLVSSPAQVPLGIEFASYALSNGTPRRIRIVSIRIVDPGILFFVEPAKPPCVVPQVLEPGEFCYVSIGFNPI